MARKTRDPDKIVRDWKGRFARTAGHKQSSNTKALRKGISERRVAVAAAAKESRTRPVDRSNAPAAPLIRVPSPDARVSTEDFGMTYKASNEKIVERARAVDDKLWDKLPEEKLPARFPLQANEETIKLKHVAKVVNGDEPFREGYITKLWRAPNGDLHIVDGHTRTAMYYALDKPMPVRIMDETTLRDLTVGMHDARSKAVPRGMHASETINSRLRSGAWRTDKKGFVNDVAGFSTDNQVAGEDNPALTAAKRAEVLKVAEDAFVKAVDAAPEIRSSMRRVVADMGGTMEREYDTKHGGIPTASKQLHSIYRKIQKEMVDTKMPDGDPTKIELKDTVRFSATFDESNYVEAVNMVRETLTKAGNKQVKPEPTLNDGAGGWELGGYRGINFAFEDANGVAFEVQIHTKQSLAVADENHKYYDLSRKSEEEVQAAMDSGEAEKATGVPPSEFPSAREYIAQLNKIMHTNAEQAPLPAGVAIIQVEVDPQTGKKRKIVVRKTSGREFVDAVTGKKIEQPERLW